MLPTPTLAGGCQPAWRAVTFSDLTLSAVRAGTKGGAATSLDQFLGQGDGVGPQVCAVAVGGAAQLTEDGVHLLGAA